jgi:hypothetical protein
MPLFSNHVAHCSTRNFGVDMSSLGYVFGVRDGFKIILFAPITRLCPRIDVFLCLCSLPCSGFELLLRYSRERDGPIEPTRVRLFDQLFIPFAFYMCTVVSL